MLYNFHFKLIKELTEAKNNVLLDRSITYVCVCVKRMRSRVILTYIFDIKVHALSLSHTNAYYIAGSSPPV